MLKLNNIFKYSVRTQKQNDNYQKYEALS